MNVSAEDFCQRNIIEFFNERIKLILVEIEKQRTEVILKLKPKKGIKENVDTFHKLLFEDRIKKLVLDTYYNHVLSNPEVDKPLITGGIECVEGTTKLFIKDYIKVITEIKNDSYKTILEIETEKHTQDILISQIMPPFNILLDIFKRFLEVNIFKKI